MYAYEGSLLTSSKVSKNSPKTNVLKDLVIFYQINHIPNIKTFQYISHCECLTHQCTHTYSILAIIVYSRDNYIKIAFLTSSIRMCCHKVLKNMKNSMTQDHHEFRSILHVYTLLWLTNSCLLWLGSHEYKISNSGIWPLKSASKPNTRPWYICTWISGPH